MTEAEIKEFKKDYLNGMKYKDLMSKYNITQGKIVWLIRRNKLTRTKSKAQIGNTNSIGNNGGAPIGNRNAFKTGEYENIYKDILSKEELQIYNQITFKDKQMLLLEQYKILTIREKRMLSRIKDLQDKNKDMTISNMSKTNYQNTSWNKDNSTTTVTQAESTTIAIQKIEEALTRIQESKRRCIESLSKIGLDNERLNIEKKKLEIEQQRLEIELQNMDGEEIEDTSETDKDLYGS